MKTTSTTDQETKIYRCVCGYIGTTTEIDRHLIRASDYRTHEAEILLERSIMENMAKTKRKNDTARGRPRIYKEGPLRGTSILLLASTHRRIRAQAYKKKMTVSHYIRGAIDTQLEKDEKSQRVNHK